MGIPPRTSPLAHVWGTGVGVEFLGSWNGSTKRRKTYLRTPPPSSVEHKIVAAPREGRGRGEEGEGRRGGKDMMCFPPEKTKERFSNK